jgi:hypothetical protein
MGGSSSKATTTNTYNTQIVNKNDLELLNKSVNDFVSNTVINQASNCSSTISQLQDVSFTDINAKGDIVLGSVDQTQSSAITFDCVQLSTFQNDIANGVLQQYMNAIQNSYSTSAISEMTAAAKTNAGDQFGSTGKAKSNSKSNNNYNFTSVTDTHQDIQNIVENAITNNMSMTDTQSCMASVAASQSVNYARITTEGNLTSQPISQTQSSSLLAKCLQEKNNGNKISNQVAAQLGLQIAAESDVQTSATMAGTSAATAENVGVFQSAGEGMASMFTGIGNMFGGIFGGMSSTPIIICLVVCCTLSILGVGGYYMYSEGGDDSQSGGFIIGKDFDILKFILILIVFIVILQIVVNTNENINDDKNEFEN